MITRGVLNRIFAGKASKKDIDAIPLNKEDKARLAYGYDKVLAAIETGEWHYRIPGKDYISYLKNDIEFIQKLKELLHIDNIYSISVDTLGLGITINAQTDGIIIEMMDNRDGYSADPYGAISNVSPDSTIYVEYIVDVFPEEEDISARQFEKYIFNAMDKACTKQDFINWYKSLHW